jgi:hypothetical protein
LCKKDAEKMPFQKYSIEKGRKPREIFMGIEGS